MAKSINWLPEKEAARIVGKAPRTLRRLVKAGTWNVSYTTLNNRNYMYDEKGIEKVFLKDAHLVN